MIAEGIVGPQTLGDGAQSRMRLDSDGALLVSGMRGRYTELALRGRLFMASLQSLVALSTLNATATGFILTNPVGSGKNLALLDVSVALGTAPAGVSVIGLAAGLFSTTAVTQTTPVSVREGLGLAATTRNAGLAASAATLPAAPVFVRAIGGGPVAASSIQSPFIRDEIAGEIILVPGTSISLSYLTTAISVLASMTWAEHDA